MIPHYSLKSIRPSDVEIEEERVPMTTLKCSECRYRFRVKKRDAVEHFICPTCIARLDDEAKKALKKMNHAHIVVSDKTHYPNLETIINAPGKLQIPEGLNVNLVSLGERVRQAIKNKNTSIKNLSLRYGFSGSGLRAVVTGKRKIGIQMIRKLILALGVTPEWLLWGSSNDETQENDKH